MMRTKWSLQINSPQSTNLVETLGGGGGGERWREEEREKWKEIFMFVNK